MTDEKHEETQIEVMPYSATAMAIERFTPERFKEIVESHTLKGVVLRKGSRRFVKNFK